MIDEILETIAEKIKSIGLDPLPIPDIDLPFSMDNVKYVNFEIFKKFSSRLDTSFSHQWM